MFFRHQLWTATSQLRIWSGTLCLFLPYCNLLTIGKLIKAYNSQQIIVINDCQNPLIDELFYNATIFKFLPFHYEKIVIYVILVLSAPCYLEALCPFFFSVILFSCKNKTFHRQPLDHPITCWLFVHSFLISFICAAYRNFIRGWNVF